MASIHETAEGLHTAGLMNKVTMRKFDENVPDACSSDETDANPRAELREGASQAVFARYLNVTTGIVSQWERGRKRPQGASLTLLTLVARNGLNAVA